MNRILVAGSANLDFVVRAAHIPAPGETVLGRDFKTYPGGKGANQAVACARAGGADTTLLLALGDDAGAVAIEASLRAAGVQAQVVRVADQPTGSAFICVSDDAENAITVAPGANNALAPNHLPALSGFSHLLLQLETPLDTVLAYARAARQQQVRVVLNAAPARVLPPELLALIDVLVVNEGELAVVSACDDGLEAALERIQVPSVVVTLGRQGCCLRAEGQLLRQAGFAVTPLDTTAAGDTFCGVLVAALGRQLPWPEALRQANAAAALACTRQGAQSSIPSAREVEDFLRSQAPGPMARA